MSQIQLNPTLVRRFLADRPEFAGQVRSWVCGCHWQFAATEAGRAALARWAVGNQLVAWPPKGGLLVRLWEALTLRRRTRPAA